MASLPKRVWSNKKLVYSNHKPVWKLDDKVGVYDPKFKEIESGETYTDEREVLDGDAEMQIYDSMQPTDIGTMNSGLVATYTFYDYDETVLKTGKVQDGGTPTAPENPTREGYTFDGWEPTVGPISKDTEYVAQYTENVEPDPDPEPIDDTCPECGGTGNVPCLTCEGENPECEVCGGTGIETCHTCDGTGHYTEPEEE